MARKTHESTYTEHTTTQPTCNTTHSVREYLGRLNSMVGVRFGILTVVYAVVAIKVQLVLGVEEEACLLVLV